MKHLGESKHTNSLSLSCAKPNNAAVKKKTRRRRHLEEEDPPSSPPSWLQIQSPGRIRSDTAAVVQRNPGRRPSAAARQKTQLLRRRKLPVAAQSTKPSLLLVVFRGYKTMSGVQLQSSSPALAIQGSQKNESSVTGATGAETKPKKKICCACPDTKKLRDECIVEHGEAACAKWIEAHRLCLRAEGFNV
ncbi:unnamed protein product [Sphenostylis stenocarpa]|uniref:Cytochrome c oxidase copper chaperone n=1 Tax=Sphenostylis stenocarpa TaxID=92480 RepID=A0AA86SNB4_9FABA|nr:unnamed protein product [Sphenostylis stenocarpa]